MSSLHTVTIDPTGESAICERNGHRWRIDVDWGVFAGRIEPTRISVAVVDDGIADDLAGPRPLSASTIRQLPIGGAVQELYANGAPHRWAERVVMEEQERAHQLDGHLRDSFLGGGDGGAQEVYEKLLASQRAQVDGSTVLGTPIGPQRGRQLTMRQLKEVADAYNAASDAHKPVTAAVAAACGISKSAAGKRIMAARLAGLLEKYEAKR